MTTSKKWISYKHPANFPHLVPRADVIVSDISGEKYVIEVKTHLDLKPENIHLTTEEFYDIDAQVLAQDGTLQPPPPWAEFLLELLATKKTRDALLGDYEEEFHENCLKPGGVARARRIYWAGVLRSLTPLIWSKVKNAGLFGLVVAAVKYFTR